MQNYYKIIIPRIDDCIQKSSSPRAKPVLKDNCPVVNATPVVDALTYIGAMHFKIPPWSPDINCIKFFFHTMFKGPFKNDVTSKMPSFRPSSPLVSLLVTFFIILPPPYITRQIVTNFFLDCRLIFSYNFIYFV